MFRPILLFCFILVFGLFEISAQSVNQAINKPTEQSSTSSNGVSNLAIDGNVNGNYNSGSVTQTNNELNAWWQVDLGSSMDISLIQLYNRSDCCSERLSNFHVFISETNLSGRSFSNILSDCSVTNIYVSNEAPLELNIPKVGSGRFVRVQLSGKNTLSLAEVRVYNSNTSSSGCEDFCVIDDFDQRLNGSIRGQGGWHANIPGALDGAIVSSDLSAGFTGKALMNDPDGVPFRGNAYKSLENHAIPNGAVGTLFFQALVKDSQNTYTHIGLTDLASPRLTDGGTGNNTLYVDYEVQMSFAFGQLRVRNGNVNSYLTNINLQNDVVYNIWIVADNQNDTYEVFVQGGTHAFPTKAMTSNGTSSFPFRNGTSESLKTLYLINSPDNVKTGKTYYDSFYFDDKKNLSIPITLSPSLSYVGIETFDELNLGAVNGQNEWVSDSTNATIILDPIDNTNKVLNLGPNAAEAYRPIPHIKDCSIGTVFFRMYRSGLVNENFGLSSKTNPSEFTDFENQLNFENTDALKVRSGNNFLSLDKISNNEWYCVWVVTNNIANTYKIYIQGKGDSSPKVLSSGSQTDFTYRNNTSNSLASFFIKHLSSSGSFKIDDIYIDNKKANLSPPQSVGIHGDGTNSPSTPLNNPIEETIVPSGLGVVLEEFVTIPQSSGGLPKARINFLGHANDNSGRFFVNDLRNKLYVIENKEVKTYLDVKSRFSNFVSSPGLGTGFGFFAFHPEFSLNGKFYTVHTEVSSKTPDYTSPSADSMQGVITEWTATNPSANVFSGTNRELLRIGFDTYIHGFQQIDFNPNAKPLDSDYGLLYLAVGDGEATPYFSGAPQDLKFPHGKILRIDPLGNNSSNGKYGIPSSNPFVNNANNVLGEIWAYGFRNPHRFSWDTAGTNKMFIANIGEKNIDALYLGLPAANYGWNEREGSFLFKKNDPNNVYPLPVNDAIYGYSYPVAEYDHDEGFAMVGGFVYRGKSILGLQGKYIFGDIVKGRIFYTEELEMISGQSFTKIHELTLYNTNGSKTSLAQLAGNNRADIRFGLDAEGEIYVLSKQNGKIWRIKDTKEGVNNVITIQENDLGFCKVDGLVKNDQQGFSGDGFLDTTNSNGSGIDWAINVPVSGSYAVQWRFSNGDTSDLKARLIVNNSGQVISNLSFDKTGAWSNWSKSDVVTINLIAGNNKIRLEATTEKGLAHIDKIDVSGNQIAGGNCNDIVGVDDIRKANTKVYPNPVKDVLNIELDSYEDVLKISIVNSLGQEIKTIEINNSSEKISLLTSDLPNGLYLIKVITDNKSFYTKKIIKI